MIEDIIDKLRKGDAESQKKAYIQYSALIFKLALRYLNNDCDAEDIVNRSFYKVFTNINKFEIRGKGSFEAWISQIAVNEILQFIRQNKKKYNLLSVSEERIEYDRHADSELTTEDYYNIIRKLPEGYRAVFNLYAIEGYSHKEIGEMLDITESTSRSQLTRARELLQKMIKKI